MISSSKGYKSKGVYASTSGYGSQSLYAGISMFNPADLFLTGDKGVFFVQNKATMWSDFPRTTETVRDGGDPSGLIAVIDNMVATGGTIEAASSAARPLLNADGIRFDYVDDSLNLDFGTGTTVSGSIVVATTHGSWYGEFESNSSGVITSAGRYFVNRDVIGILVIDRTLTIAEKQRTFDYFVRNGANSVQSNLAFTMMWDWGLTSIDAEALAYYDGTTTSLERMLSENSLTSISLFDTGSSSTLSRMLHTNNLTSLPMFDTRQATEFTAFAFNNSLTSAAINDFLLKLKSDNDANPRSNVDARFMFSSGTNAPWTSLSAAAQQAAQDLKDNYNWDFTNAFNGGGPA